MRQPARHTRRFSHRLLPLLACFATVTANAQALQHNPFDDPFVAVTSGLPNCPVPQEPVFTDEQYKAEAHDRAQRGVSCWMAGRCRLHSAYLYDKEIIPRVKQAITVAGRFTNTSVWALGQRRYVWLKGCVATAEQAAELERLVRTIDDVDGVQNELMVGSQGQPPYATAR
ncbi:BON domain-containing protein [Ideonella sp. BN130291]|uniref:BON domain-containing protein n=1 Tax=Ideonella sp. BN130291 TaxID=3112940 RepID=UPI002E26AE69|nr:BON domain-containing protein [Ideonella sp. BN130291]